MKHNVLINRLLLLINYFMWAKALHSFIFNTYEIYWPFWIISSYLFSIFVLFEIDKETIYD
jgi:hypothetical protein